MNCFENQSEVIQCIISETALNGFEFWGRAILATEQRGGVSTKHPHAIQVYVFDPQLVKDRLGKYKWSHTLETSGVNLEHTDEE
jgi:hypothetical protein